MTDDELINAARRAAGSEVLPRVMLGAYRADDLLLKMAARIEALTASCNAVMHDRKLILEERDRTFALMIARAEKAEAERDAVVEALEAMDAALCIGFETQSGRMAGRKALIASRAILARIKGGKL